MPLPVPNNNEKKSDFMSRCVTNLTDKKEFKDNQQRVAVCMNIFSDSESKASVVIGEGKDKKLFFTEAANENKTLNKPFRTSKGPKKFSVYVKNKKGNVVKVNFGDPNMEIKRDDPKRRKAFRSRHSCDTAKDKTTPRYWSCKMWSAKSVTKITKASEEYDWDGETLFDHNELLSACPSLAYVDEITEESEAAKRSGPKSGAQTPAEPSERKKGSKKNKKGSAKKGGGKITFSEKTTNALKEKVKEHNEKSSKKVTLGQLKRVYRRGAGAFSTSHRPNMSRHGWAMARVNTFLKMMRGGKVKESYRKADQDIAKAAHYGKKKKSYGSPDVNKHYFETKEEAEKDSEKMGLKGIHTHKTDDGKTLYMAGPNHEAFMKRHNEILKEKEKSDSSLWENIRKKKERIKRGSGEKMRKKGDKGAPTSEQIERAKGSEQSD
jgi:hypothetical protein